MNHPTVPCYFFGQAIDVDEEIAPLIKSTWELDCLTMSSCQGDDGGDWPHIGFLNGDHLLRWLEFISALALGEDDYDEGDELGFSTLYYRMAPWKLVTHSHPDQWRYNCRVLREEPGGQPFIEPFLEFPRRDIPRVERLLAEAVVIYRGEGGD